MILVKIELQNFRSYFGTEVVDLTACAKNPERNIVAVGGLNGAGKTSLLEAIAFGLLGVPDAFKFMEGIERRGDGKEQIDRAQDGLLNREAMSAGEREVQVTLSFRDDDGSIFIVQRTWHYDYRGKYKADDLLVTTDKGEIEEDKYSDFLKNRIPPRIAKFFFFDGEKIQELAADEVGAKTKEGIDQLLGFHVLDDLISDMDKLQDDYRKDAKKRNRQEEELGDLRGQETRLVNKVGEIQDEQVELEEKIDVLKERNRALVDELTELLGGEEAISPKELQRQLDQTNDTIADLKDALFTAVDRSVVPALPGELLVELDEQLSGEDLRWQWEEGKRRVEPQRDRLLDRVFGPDAPGPEPSLAENQVNFLRGRIQQEWDDLFNPPPEGIAEESLHILLSSEERTQAKNKCSQVLRSGVADIRNLLSRLDSAERRSRDLRQQLERIGDGKRANEIIDEKTQVDRDLGEAQQGWESFKRQLLAIQTDLRDIRQKIQKKEDELTASAESGDRAAFVRKVKRAIQQYQEALRPKKRDEVASRLTEMYRRLARKEDVVDRIELDEKTYRPRLLDRRGKPMPLHTLSAGEREIYALSLLWALGKASRRELPVVIDTPLARLDSEHRANIVKKYLPTAGPQVVVLSTDTELDREYFQLVEDRVAVMLHLDFDPASERTAVREGFFDFV